MVQSVLVDVNEARTDVAPEDVAALLRERIYGGIACLSTLLLLLRSPGEESSAWSVVLDVVVATGSLWAASVLADLVAHMAAHGVAPRGAEAGRMFRRPGRSSRRPWSRWCCSWWKRLLIVAALIGLGALVVLLKTLAH
jgi:hypothetical protein